ncbi:RadC family protein [Desulfobulbus alkaliphilus]|uniref:RadC family protein n=1 Tax=Desulfobulbus alkaliphilus TaxID=869814 RepID=UPI001965CC22|nr:DNA repair protein RadC [Desulfobulbus alkaliphilus]
MDKDEWQQKGAGHRQRLRDKFLAQGIEAFTDSEIIELLLTFGTPRSDCKDAARGALAKFKTLPAVLDASPGELQQIKGVGPKNIFALRFIQGVARRYLQQRIVGKHYVHSSRQVADYLIHAMRGLPHEVLRVVFLDAAHAVIDSDVVAEGTVTVNTVYPRELIKAALARNASALVIAHNHPSGALAPSRQDEELTRSLHLICSFMHINLLDHLIIGDGDQVYSFADQGLMARIRDECRRILERKD